ncbi:hypothetical protein ACQR1Y_12380 [Bradyrhizobium sp. HKCCYLRH3099]|uniref:hypothetical protein n=1 Tax=Bradyrhizobium TaxID=374 RepID=UPI003EB734F5
MNDPDPAAAVRAWFAEYERLINHLRGLARLMAVTGDTSVGRKFSDDLCRFFGLPKDGAES